MKTPFIDAPQVRADALYLVAYGFFLGFAVTEWYGIFISQAGTSTLFGVVIGAAAAILLAGNLELAGRWRKLNVVVAYHNAERTRGRQAIIDLVGVAILVSTALYLREFPEFMRGLAGRAILIGIALMVLPAAALIAVLRMVGIAARLGRTIIRSRPG
jgi:hypothetical protein